MHVFLDSIGIGLQSGTVICHKNYMPTNKMVWNEIKIKSTTFSSNTTKKTSKSLEQSFVSTISFNW